MKQDVLVSVEGLNKKFCRELKTSLWYGVKDLASEFFGRTKNGSLRAKEFYAVNDVSFELRRGECLGLIGHNGAGKSTLLKMLNGLIKPDQGSITMFGRVSALIELGAGFNPLLTGRENIFINGQVLGFSRKEVQEKFDAIVEFSEIEDFIDTPVQNYSSGMKVRLGFAVAAQMEPDVLLIDEVLAVGDIGFVLKCFNRMDALLSNTAIILVSHNIPQIARMCTQLILMKRGNVVYNSPDVAEGISLYYSMFKQKVGNYIGSDIAHLEEIALESNGKKSEPGQDFQVEYGDDLLVKIKVRTSRAIQKARIYLAFYDKEQRIFGEVMNFTDQIKEITPGDCHTFQAHFSRLEFSQGVFSITVGMNDLSDNSRTTLFRMQSAIFFHVKGKHHGWAPMQFQPEWKKLE